MKKNLCLLLFLAASLPVWSEPTEIKCGLKPLDRSRFHKKSAVTNQTSSENWSGYVAAPSLTAPVAGSVSYVAGSWKVPDLSATPDTSYCAIWVGIDGFTSATVEQTGTEHDWSNGAQTNYAWFEMYPQGSYEITGFPVNVGDQISARIGYKGNNIYKMVLTNITQNVTTTIPTADTTSSSGQRSCAEWVVEAPYSGEILPLADFKLATFNYCSATIEGVTGAINNGKWVEESIEMVSASGAAEATPSALLKNGACFQVTWVSE